MPVKPKTTAKSQQQNYYVVLAGNPNCGKTTVFNRLTGSRYKVANYPGVTVEKKIGKFKSAQLSSTYIVDLPGIYNLSGSALDEKIAAANIIAEEPGMQKPDLIVCVLDAANLERNLYLTSQLVDLEIPMVLAINMIDSAEKDGITIRTESLSRLLDLPVVAISASKKIGLEQLEVEIKNQLNKKHISSKNHAWLDTNSRYSQISSQLGQLQSSSSCPKTHGISLLSNTESAANEEIGKLLLDARTELHSLGLDSFSYEASARYRWISAVVRQSTAYSSEQHKYFYEKIDGVITHKIWGSLIFLLLMAFIFQSIFLWASYPMDLIDSFFVNSANWTSSQMQEGILKSLVVDGVIAGVGSVIIFIPQIALLFFFLGLLEDSGYLSRAAFLMDKLMRKVGLQGRSFIPLLSSFACAIPGIMSTRTIPSFTDRMATILVAPLMSCSARLPVYALLIAAFVPSETYFGIFSLQGLVLLGMYLAGIFAAAFVAWILKVTLLKGEPAIFVMEMPRFRRPSIRLVIREVLDRIAIFIKSAGTIILACSIVLWFLASYPQGKIEDSYAGKIGHFMEPAIRPLGFNWEIGVGILASFAAREVFISSLSTVYNLAKEDDTSDSLMNVLQEKREAGTFTQATAISLMIFYVFACQCMSTLAVCKRETGSWSWTAFMFLYMTGLAYFASLITYNLLK